MHRPLFSSASLAVLLAACAPAPAPAPTGDVRLFEGARVLDGTGAAPAAAAILVRDGRVVAAGAVDEASVPEGAERIEVTGKTIVPGLVVAHAHVGGTRGLETGPEVYTEENILDQLRLYARYGVTTVVSLGGDGEAAVRVRSAQNDPSLDRARLFIAGRVIATSDPDEALRLVDENVALGVDFIKIRVDDQLGTTEKMPPEAFRAAIDRAHEHGLKVAAHVFYLEDAKELARAGVDILAHSVRDREVDDELVTLLRDNGVCYCPTLTREVSTFVYEDVPAFFEDPFFLAAADPAVLEQLRDPERQRAVRESRAARAYKEALEVAKKNLGILADAGVPIVFGTDTGPPGRFQGYFEHMEMELMAEAGLTPAQILRAATGEAARCLGLAEVGTIEPGRWADLVVVDGDPLADIAAMRRIDAVFIAGNSVPGAVSAAAAATETAPSGTREP